MFEPQYVWMCASLCIHKKDSSRALSLASRFPSAPMCRLCLCAMNIEWQRVGHSNAHTFSLCIAFCLPDCLFPSHRFAENVSFFLLKRSLICVCVYICVYSSSAFSGFNFYARFSKKGESHTFFSDALLKRANKVQMANAIGVHS